MKLIYTIVTAVILLTGCASKNTTPSGIAYDFWLAEKEHKPQNAAKYTIKEDPDATKLHHKIKIAEIKLQDPEINGNEAQIPTVLILKDFSPLNNDEASVSFETKMQKKDKEWRINMFETKKALYLAIGKTYAQTLGKDFANSVQQALGDGKEIKSIFQQLIHGLQKAVNSQNKLN